MSFEFNVDVSWTFLVLHDAVLQGTCVTADAMALRPPTDAVSGSAAAIPVLNSDTPGAYLCANNASLIGAKPLLETHLGSSRRRGSARQLRRQRHGGPRQAAAGDAAAGRRPLPARIVGPRPSLAVDRRAPAGGHAGARQPAQVAGLRVLHHA